MYSAPFGPKKESSDHTRITSEPLLGWLGTGTDQKAWPCQAFHGNGDAVRTGTVALLHRDPFDRLLICQARYKDLILVTNDENIRQYEVNVA